MDHVCWYMLSYIYILWKVLVGPIALTLISCITQDYLREQLDNIKSVNLVAETARFLSLLYSSINHNTVGLVTELFNTVVEFSSVSLTAQMRMY